MPKRLIFDLLPLAADGQSTMVELAPGQEMDGWELVTLADQVAVVLCTIQEQSPKQVGF